jgi:signal transduction histidine kinase
VASFFVIKGRDRGRRFELEQDTVAIGRDSVNSIHLHDTEASRRHAEVRRDGSGFTLTDLDSSNGTFVNGRRVKQHDLASGDQVRMGTSVMLYTGPSEHTAVNAAEGIDIVDQNAGHEESRIVRSMRQSESSDIFQGDDAAGSPWLARARSNLQVMYRTALAVSHTLDIDQLLDRIMELIFEWVECDRGCVMLTGADDKSLHPRARRDRKKSQADDKIVISQTILDYVQEHNEGVLTSNAREDERWDTGASILQMGIREAICVPMQGRYDVVGVIYIDTTTPAHRVIERGGANKFTEEHLKLMIAIGHQAALAVEDTSYYSAMVQSERLAAVGQTIAMLSHHIKNILQGIRGGSYMIEMGLEDHAKSLGDENSIDVKKADRAGETIRRGWDIVEKNQEKISNLVLDMLSFSKEREPQRAEAELNEVVGDVVELMRVRAEEREVTLDWQPGDVPTLTFDPDGMHRAVLNLVTNAIDACEDVSSDGDSSDGNGEERARQVTVSTEYAAEESLARVIVEDNGCGIAPEDLDKVFTLFESRKGSRGTGLGLPVSQKILREHGGQITVESTPGSGSRFIVELPAIMPKPEVAFDPTETAEYEGTDSDE